MLSFWLLQGNDGNTILQYPGAYNNVICVGSVNSNDSKSSFSNYNGTIPFVDIASPGGYSNGGLLSTVYSAGGDDYAQNGWYFNGYTFCCWISWFNAKY